MKVTQILASLASAALTVQPAVAAEDLRVAGTNLDVQTDTFARAHLRVPLGSSGTGRERPTARLQLGVGRVLQDRQSAAPTRSYHSSAFELGLSRHKARPALFVAGMPARALERRLGVSTGGAIAIGAGVVALLLVAAVAASPPPDIFGEE